MSRQRKQPEQLRSYRWYGPDDLRSFGHRSRTKQMGYWREEFVGRPVIGIINTWNDLNTCHTHFPERVKDIKRGITAAGGFAVELPAMSLGEQLMKPTAAEPRLLKHRGPAVAFENIRELKAHIDDEDLDVTADSVLVLKNAGPVGGPGMPEWGMPPIPQKLLKQGVRDMVRISDARMSGTSYGACILHVAPEAAVGGPLALVQTGDLIEIDVEARRIDLLVDEEELNRRRTAWQPPPQRYTHGYASLYVQHVTQADQGCDFDFMQGAPGSTPEPDIF